MSNAREIERDDDGYIVYEKGWRANSFRKLKLDIARAARKEWLAAEPWVREQILREESRDAEG